MTLSGIYPPGYKVGGVERDVPGVRAVPGDDPSADNPAGNNPAGSDPAGSDPAGSDPAGRAVQAFGPSWPDVARRVLGATSVLAVCAHPDDETFGLGALLAALADGGMRTAVLSLTRGEASTLGADVEDLAAERSRELAAAAAALGARVAGLHDHPDGSLETVPMVELAGEVVAAADEVAADLLLVFDPGGVTGHPDHRRATEAALVAAGRTDRPVLAWTLPADVAEALNQELSTGFVGVEPALVDLELRVDRAAQLAAIACHGSQSDDNPVLRRRLELQGGVESTRWLRRTAAIHPPAPPAASGASGTARTGRNPEGSTARQGHGGDAGSTGDGLVAVTIETT